MKQGHAEIAVLIDRSGSMMGMEDVVCKGFNTFLWQQVCAHGTANLTITLFDHETEAVTKSEPIQNVPALTEDVYFVRGGTALYDSLGITITELAARIKRMDEEDRPETVIVAVTTDGYENESMEWTASQIRDLIEQKKSEGWEFMYISAVDDADAERLGYAPEEISFYEKDEDGTYDSYLTMSTQMLGYRGRGGSHE